MDHYELRFLNGLAGDPAVQFFLPASGDVFLFDLGSIEALTPREVLKIRSAFVSHTHIDHFYGFDRLLRVNVPHFREIEICGPEGLLANVRGKLAGYNWNLLDPGQVRFLVREVSREGEVASHRLTNETRFSPQPVANADWEGPRLPPPPARPGAVVSSMGGSLRVDAIALDHGIPSMAYRCSFPGTYKVKTDVLAGIGLRPGPWIRELQIALNNGKEESVITVDGKEFSATELRDTVLEVLPSHAVGYITDAIFSEENLHKAKILLHDIDLLICETNYHDADRRKAFEKKHFTTTQAAALAHYVGARRLRTFHISNLYAGNIDAVIQHAADEFKRLGLLGEEERAQAILACTQ